MTASVEVVMPEDSEDTGAPGPLQALSARLGLHQVFTRDILVLAALSGVAITQPLLDLFGRNPEIFVAQDVRRRDIVVFALVVTFAVPLACLVLELVASAIGPRVRWLVHAGLVAVLSCVLGLLLASKLGAGDVLSVLIALGAAVGITFASLNVPVVEQILRYLSPAMLLFLFAFLFFSRTGDLIRSGEAAIAEGVRVGNPAPIVIIQFDEIPVASLLDVDREINAERFPNFHRLAESASWFRNATSQAPNTAVSVPSALSGLMPESGDLPISADHPNTLFTLLGAHYRFDVEEPVTDLCPSSVCDPPVIEPEDVPDVNLYGDAFVVYERVVLPPFLVDGLPAVDQSWGGFLANVDDPEDDPVGDEAIPSSPTDSSSDGLLADEEGVVQPASQLGKWKDQDPSVWAPRYQAGLIEQQINSIEGSETPTVWFTHAVFPHSPWHLAPSGDEFRRGDSRAALDGVVDGKWVEDEWYVRHGLQRHLLQVGYADTLIGEMIDKLQATGLWEEALVVVMADHGVAFEPSGSPRDPTNVAELYNVPLFIKPPGVTEGEVRDEDARLIDVLPSIVDLLEIRTDWEFDGWSLFDDEPAPERDPVDPAATLAVVERNLEWLPHGDSVSAIAAVGEYGDLVGRSLDTLDVVGASDIDWSLDQEADLVNWTPRLDRFVPLLWNGSVVMPGGAPPPPELLAVVNGEVAGVVGGFGQAGTAPDRFSGIIAQNPLVVGFNEVTLLVPIDGGTRFEQTGPPTIAG